MTNEQKAALRLALVAYRERRESCAKRGAVADVAAWDARISSLEATAR